MRVLTLLLAVGALAACQPGLLAPTSTASTVTVVDPVLRAADRALIDANNTYVAVAGAATLAATSGLITPQAAANILALKAEVDIRFDQVSRVHNAAERLRQVAGIQSLLSQIASLIQGAGH